MANDEAVKIIEDMRNNAIGMMLEKKQIDALDVAIEALRRQDVPDVNVGDAISRQAAIDALGEEPPVWYDGEDELAEREQWRRDVNAIKALPPAQPEIIRCEDCRYAVDEYGDGDCYCKRPARELVWIGGRWDFFCAAAKRRTEVEHETD